MIRQIVNTFGRGASLIVTNRRWGATLSAAALGFGLFVGVAIGPGAAGTLATGPRQLIEIPSLAADDTDGGEGSEAAGPSRTLAGPTRAPAPVEEASSLEAFSSASPPAPEAIEPPAAEEPIAEPKAPAGEAPAEEEEETTELAGTVVHANPAAGSYTLAIADGELVPVHAAKLPRAGLKLKIAAGRLVNGTFAEAEILARSGSARQASFRGAVTFVDPDPLAPGYTVSGRGASLFVEVAPDPTGVVPALPALGAYVTVAAAIEPAAVLAQREVMLEPGPPATYLDISGIYAGLDAETGRLLLSADDTRAGEHDLSLAVPAAIDVTKLRAGDSYLATATIEADGSLTLAGIADDERLKGAEDPSGAQGDLKRRARTRQP